MDSILQRCQFDLTVIQIKYVALYYNYLKFNIVKFTFMAGEGSNLFF